MRLWPIMWALVGCFDAGPTPCAISCSRASTCPVDLTCIDQLCTTVDTVCSAAPIYDAAGTATDASPILTPDAAASADATDPADGGLACPPEWLAFGGHCYYLNTTQQGASAANADCAAKLEAFGYTAHLVVIESALENAWLADTFLPGTDNDFWIGLRLDNYQLRWTDGTTLGQGDYHAFSGAPPSGSGSTCVEMITGGVWNPSGCGASEDSVCEVEDWIPSPPP